MNPPGRAPRPSLPLKLDPRGLADPGKPALIGVSGGRDSVALLHALAPGRRLVVCHLDHGLRPESAEEARFVREFAATLNCEIEIGRVRVAVRAAKEKQSLETAARAARYAFFERVARRRGLSALYLAHHADDQAETFLHHLLRGAGSAGLAAMTPSAARGKLLLWRPLLGTWRAEIDAYLAAHRLPFREDPSNADPRHTRNRLRHRVIPFLEEEYGREVRPALWRAAEILAAESAYLENLPELANPPARLSVARLRALPIALQRRLLHRWLQHQAVPQIGYAAIEAARGLLNSVRPARINLPSSWHVRRRDGELFIDRPDAPA